MATYADASEMKIVSDETVDNTNGSNADIKSIINDIKTALKIEDTDNEDRIVNDLLESGRQSLVKYDQEISPEIYTCMMASDDNQLIILLKKYFQQKWETQYGTSYEWFRSFLKQYQDDDNYQCVLQRTAKYGNKYMKTNPILSIILQVLFKCINDECLKTTNVFDELWSTVTNNGLKSILKYSDYIEKDVLDRLINKEQLVLFKALCEYYRPQLFELLTENEIQDKENIYELALNGIVENGWLNGIEAIKTKIPSKGFKILLDKISSQTQSSITNVTTKDDTSVTKEKNTTASSATTSQSGDTLAQQNKNGPNDSDESLKDNNLFDKFKVELKLLWIKYKVDDELDFNRVAQQLFDENMTVLEEIEDNTTKNNFKSFNTELMASEKFKGLWNAERSSNSSVTDNSFIEFKSEITKVFASEKILLDEDELESFLQKLYDNKEKNIADLTENILVPRKIKQFIVKIQSNEKLKIIWKSNMIIFDNIKNILSKHCEFFNGNNDEIYIIIAELYINSDNGMKLIEAKCTQEKFNNIKIDLYNDQEIRSKVLHGKDMPKPIVPTINIDNYKREIDIIKRCTKTQSNLFQLEDLVQAGEIQYINQTLKNISDKLVDDFLHKDHNFPNFIHNCLTPIMYLLKRLQNLDDFMDTLLSKYRRIQLQTNSQSTEITNISLRMFLHILFMKSDMFLRRIIMSLISKRNPIPFVSPNILNWKENEQYEFMPAIIHVWNYTRPTILSFGIGPCQGKSTLLNQLFQSTFEQSVDSIYFKQTIDIDFGYCFNPERTLNIADAHGIIDKKLLKRIQLLFDGFLIQIDKIYLDDQPQILLEYIECLSTDKFQMIIIRDTSNQNLQESLSIVQNLIKKLSNKLCIYPLINVSNTNDRNIIFAIGDLRDEILTKIKENIPKNVDRKKDVLPNLEKLVNKDYVDYLNKMNKIIQPLKQHLLQRNEYQNEHNFPLYLKFQELCKVRQRLKKLDFYGSESETMFEINQKLYELECQLDPNTKTSVSIKCGYVFDAFIEILKSENMLMSLDLLSSELKSAVLSLGADKLAGNLAVETAFLSLEVLWRNAVVCHNHTTNENQNRIIKSYQKFVAAGFPFEIIDGDNFYFQQQFLTKILNEFASQRILVISIIGPQNSGKSTLLNYMFGTLFDVRDGRCTRGIYGSLVKLTKLNESNDKILCEDIKAKIADIDYIMLIDTEGLLSIEKGDKEYDRRLVLFALAVSHLVIVNMMCGINEILKDMLTLCADSLKQIGVNTTNQPIVHFVLNQKPDPNLKNHMEAIQKLIEDLKEKELAEVIDISEEKFHTLPSAFKKERVSSDTGSPCFLRTEPDFIERAQQLCEKIIGSAKGSYERSRNMFSDPPQWLRTAVNIFDTLQKFPDLTYFKDINERRQYDQIREGIRDLLAITLTASYREKLINETCVSTEYQIRQRFQMQFNIHQDDFDIVLENTFKATSASEDIRDRCKKFLKRQVTEISNAWCTAAIQMHDQKQMESLVRDGSSDLRNLIDDIIKSGKTMDKREATQEFENMWSKKLESIKTNFNPEERLKQAIKFVYGNYNIFEKQSLPAHEVILQSLQFIILLSQKSNTNEVITSIRENFCQNVSKLQKNILESCWKQSNTNTEHTLDTLHNFKHLNKEILNNMYTAGSVHNRTNCNFQEMNEDKQHDQVSTEQDTKSSKDGWLKKQVQLLANALNIGSTGTTSSEKPSQTKPTPLRFDFMTAVHKTIYDESASVESTKSNILDILKLFDIIIHHTMAIVHGNGEVHRPIEIDLIQKIVGLINGYVNDINLELIVFKLSLSKQTISLIHVHILCLLTIFYYDEQKNHFNQQLKTLEEEKKSLLNYFIGMIVPDAECDKEGANILANQIKNLIQSNLMRNALVIIARNIQSQQNLSRKHIQTICDGKLQAAVSDNHDWLYRYIDAPTDIIVKEFEELWKAVENTINQQLEIEKNTWRNTLTNFFDRINSMISALADEGSSVQYIDDIFEASGGTAEENLKNKGQCMVLLLYTYLSGDKIETGASYTVFSKNYTLKPKGLRLFEKVSTPTEQLSNLVKSMKGTDASTGNQMVIPTIKNLREFLKSIMDVRDEVENNYDKSPATFIAYDKDQIYNKLLDKARGCIAKCPCCDRPCDVDHTVVKSNPGDEDNRHACQTGHQLRAMAGIKFEVSNEASLSQCEQMEDNKPIIVRGTKKKWLEFKKDHSDWDFGNSITRDELFTLRSKFLNVWSKIGSRLCQKYDMKYVTENTPQAAPKPFHYVLMLDASGSMSGKPWDNLMDGVKEFVKIRTDSNIGDRITIIVFYSKATYAYFNVDIKTVDINQIKFTGGGTDFGSAFNLVIETIQKIQVPSSTSNSVGNLEFIIIFMSDGDASFPNSQLETLLTMKSKINQFWTVALGQTRMDALEQINQKMGGTFKELKDSADLVDVYAEIARN